MWWSGRARTCDPRFWRLTEFVFDPTASSMNDDRSPLLDLMNCIDCEQTMKLEKVSPDDHDSDIIQYRCKLCGRIERLRLFRRSRVWEMLGQRRGAAPLLFSCCSCAPLSIGERQ